MAENLTVEIGQLYEKQLQFCRSKAKFTGYGGARGGGKTHVLCSKASQLALKYSGIRIAIIRRTFKQLEGEIVPKLQSILGRVARYVGKRSEFIFPNGSTIKLAHYQTEMDKINFQGMNYDVIFMDEATQFTEKMFNVLTLCLRLSGRVKDLNFKPRMYLTCNPGGVGHMWFKKLFIDKKYTEGQNPNDYCFIPSLVFDNQFLMQNNPDYVNQLKALPEKERMAMLYGDWNVFEGQFFDEFDESIHTCLPTEINIQKHWNIYRTRDYGLDKTACYWVAKDEEGTFYVYRELWESDLTAKKSGDKINALTLPNEKITLDICPPDLWNKQSQTGQSIVDILIKECKQRPIKANNDLFVGCMLLKELLQINSITGKPRLIISTACPNLIHSLKMIQHDEKNVNVYAKQPHELTHSVDAIRYLATSYTFNPHISIEEYEKEKFDFGMFALEIGKYARKDNESDYGNSIFNFDEGEWFI